MTNAEIEARLAAIRERCEEAKGPWIFRDNITERVEFFCQFARTEMPWLLSQLAEARKDSERLDWLEGERERELEYLNRHGPYIPALFRMNMPITREAIDAAMEKDKDKDKDKDKETKP